MASKRSIVREEPTEQTGSVATIPSGQSFMVQQPSFKNVLVCTDFSPVSQLAISEAVHLCRTTGAQLYLLHVCEPEPLASRNSSDRHSLIEITHESQSELDALLTKVQEDGVSAEGLLREGKPARTILGVLEELSVDLAVMGTHGFSGLERMVFGSTVETVLRSASCPVMTIGSRAGAHKEHGVRGPVVFATNFVEPTTQAIRFAAQFANQSGTRVHCLNVLPVSMESETEPTIISQIMSEALHHLVAKEPIFADEPIRAVTYGSELSHAIVDYAKVNHAELIVLGIRRKPNHAANLLPRVTYRIIVTASCPVLAVSFPDNWPKPGCACEVKSSGRTHH